MSDKEEYIGWLDDEWNTVLDMSQPLVRCRDCKFWWAYKSNFDCDKRCHAYTHVELITGPNSYCNLGVRKVDA